MQGPYSGEKLMRMVEKKITAAHNQRLRPENDWKSPVKWGAGLIVATFVLCGGWASMARLDSAVTAEGRVNVENERKSIQHLEGGIVSTILARDGDRVKEGDVLMTIDPIQSQASLETLKNQLVAFMAEDIRLQAEINNDDNLVFPPAFRTNSNTSIIEDQTRQFIDRKKSRYGERDILMKRISALEEQKIGVISQKNATAKLVASLKDELSRLKPLLDKQYIPLTRYTTTEREMQGHEGRVGALDSELMRMDQNIGENKLQIEQINRKAMEENTARLTDLRNKVTETKERIKVVEDIVSRSGLRAPKGGRIVGSKVHTVGAVIRAGDTVMEIVPDDDTLVVTARMSPLDINHVHAGMKSEVRLPSFKSRTTPVALGEVLSIGADALQDTMTRQSYYDIKVSVKTSDFPEAVREQLRAGMPAEVIIPTGERTVLSYLIQPLSDAMRHGMREQ